MTCPENVYSLVVLKMPDFKTIERILVVVMIAAVLVAFEL